MSAIEALLPQALESRVRHLEGHYADELRAFYEARRYRPAWVRENGFTPHGAAFVDFLVADERTPSMHFLERHLVEIERLASVALEEPPAAAELEAERLGELEVAMSRAASRYADHMTGGRLRPRSVSDQWFLQDVKADLAEFLADANESDDIAGTFLNLAESHDGYQPLRDALEAYRRMSKRGGWTRVPDGEKLERGSRGPAVVALRGRLAVTGDLPAEATEASRFDEALETAVQAFQKRHGLEPDGVVGESTFDALKLSVEQKIRQLELNLERRRWMPESFGAEYVLVNIPDFKLSAHRDSRLELEMRVVVGKPMHATPVFADQIELAVFRPYWNVPISIAVNEILPKARDDADYLARNNYEIVGPDATPVAMTELTAAALRRGLVRIRQRPGPGNALGLVKFLFPNSHHIYLHDTPADHLFARSERAFSHGCIRLENPPAFASYVLDGEWSAEEILEAMHGPTELAVPLPRKIPVYLTYMTAWVDGEGRVQFRDDVYGLDEPLARELALQKERDASWRPALAVSMKRFLQPPRI